MPHQEALTIQAPIKAGEMQALKDGLSIVDSDIEGNPLVPFGSFQSVHFARFVILEETRDLAGLRIPPSLVFAANVDAPIDARLDELLEIAGEGIDRLFGHCEGYPAPDRWDASRRAFLREHMIPTQAFYVNTVGRTVRQVRDEARLRNAIEDFLDAESAKHGWKGWSTTRIHSAVNEFVARDATLRSTLERAEGLPVSWRLRERAAFVGTLLVLLVLSPLFLLCLPVLILVLRRHEQRDAREARRLRISSNESPELRLREDHIVQNQISAVGFVKPSRFRRITLNVLLRALDFAARHVYNHGDLGTVKPLKLHGVDTIHFAHWIVIDNGRRVLFLSNYDGSLMSYMDDFVNKVAWGLNAVFSNGMEYPKTRWLFLDGANDEQSFKAFLHKHQIPTQAWYAGYKDLSAINIANNTRIRRGLTHALTENEAAEWLQHV